MFVFFFFCNEFTYEFKSGCSLKSEIKENTMWKKKTNIVNDQAELGFLHKLKHGCLKSEIHYFFCRLAW